MARNNNLLSIIIPCQNEAKNITPLYQAIVGIIPKNIDYEIIFVSDGSTDDTNFEIKKLTKKKSKVKGIIFYRNFGHQSALRAGIRVSKGDMVITMDGDFQHPPENILQMLKKYKEGFDLIQGQKCEDRHAGFIMHFLRFFGYRFWQVISGGILLPRVSDFRLMSRDIADYIVASNETQFFLRGQVQLIAQKSCLLEYKVGKRLYGKSKYTLKKFFNMFLNGVVSFGLFPIRILWLIGLVIFFSSSSYFIFDLIYAILVDKSVIEGYKSLILIFLIINGFIILYLGVLGEYIGVIFNEVKKRPIYWIKETYNIKNVESDYYSR